MGSGIGDKVAGIFGDASQKQLSNKQQLGDSGQSVGDLRNIGYTDDQLKQLGAKATAPSDLQLGLAQGFSAGGQAYDASAQPKGPAQPTQIPVDAPQSPIAQSNTDFLNKLKMPVNKRALYGG